MKDGFDGSISGLVYAWLLKVVAEIDDDALLIVIGVGDFCTLENGALCHVWQSSTLKTPATPLSCGAKRVQLQQLQLHKKLGVGGLL